MLFTGTSRQVAASLSYFMSTCFVLLYVTLSEVPVTRHGNV